jgi:hypothetical protein
MSGAEPPSATEEQRPRTSHGASVPRQRAARQLVGTGAALTTLAILLALGTPGGGASGGGTGLAGAAFVVGFGLLLLGVHRVGRLGPQ